MDKEYVLLSGERVSLKRLSKKERKAIKDIEKRAIRDPEGENVGEYFALLRLTAGDEALLPKYKQFMKGMFKEICYRVMLDVAHRAGIRQGLLLSPEYYECAKNFKPTQSVVGFAEAAYRLRVSYKTLRELLLKGELDGHRFGETWLVYLVSLEDYLKRKSE